MNRRLLVFAATTFTTTLLMLTAAALGGDSTWKAGAAKAMITPEKLMWMAGYGSRTRPADGKLTELWAKALVLEDQDGNRGLVLTLDLVGIDRTLSQAVCNSLKEKYGLQREQIAICTSHTHSGPVVGHNLAPLHYRLIDASQQQLVDEWVAGFQKQVVAVVGEAISNLAPSWVSWGSGTTTLAVNRRENPAATVPQWRTEGKLKGPSDYDVPVLAVRDANEKLTAVLFGYACHATTLSGYQWSGDYPGYAQIDLEKAHPGCVALFFAGCGADQNPLPQYGGNGGALWRAIGNGRGYRLDDVANAPRRRRAADNLRRDRSAARHPADARANRVECKVRESLRSIASDDATGADR
ncbi:MAG: neutral/alkaline non-lysosomal ceramidase N-terminal domain-containing protein [Pirellulaceae bacterium]